MARLNNSLGGLFRQMGDLIKEVAILNGKVENLSQKIASAQQPMEHGTVQVGNLGIDGESMNVGAATNLDSFASQAAASAGVQEDTTATNGK